MGLERLSPNLDPITAGERFNVVTQEHMMTLEIRRNGPHTSGHYIAFVAAEPPITEAPFFPGEISVKEDEVISGKVFELSSVLPLFSRAAFRAIEITALPRSNE